MKQNQFEILIVKYLQGTLSVEEHALFSEILSQSEQKRKQFEHFQKIWDEAVALHYSDEIDLEQALKVTKKQIPQFKKRVIKLQWLVQAAAVLLLSLVFGATITYFTNQKPASPISAAQPVYEEIKAAYGTQTKISLADGTSVWLNSGSQLKFPSSFENQPTRHVELIGEGYFEVSKNPQQPFVVHANDLSVKVLGTSFNVNAYQQDHVQVALVEGKVSLSKTSNGKSKELLQLKPSEVADYDKQDSEILLSTADRIQNYMAWTEGKIVLSDVSTEELINRLESWYNVKIEVAEPSLWNNHFTGTFDDESLDQVLKYLSISTSFKYRFVEPGGIGVPNTDRQTVVLYR